MLHRAASPGMYIAYFVQSLILLNVGISVSLGDLFLTLASLAAFSLTLIPSILNRNLGMRLPWQLTLLIALSIYLHVAGHVGELYLLYAPCYDKIAHLVSSVTLTIIGFAIAIFADQIYRMRLPRGAIVLFAVFFTISMGAVWEIYEFAADQIFGMTLQQGNSDTMVDLMVDGIGALVVAVLGDAYLRRVPKEAVAERFLHPAPEERDTLLPADGSEAPFHAEKN
ncbi:DUF2238 domain-containing protein [Methanoculleus sp. FWC-SCC1]|uniref:DUF2238 domain-containing protein n=1 Tax=Methanoculleus frigidifontis TaxID=2584085 RepID=A0ABT8M610_9EURY|nr:hypothetical protein [Methanoculleus sp. FWC-SCC1]MDN7023363.1 DUF2238 domain-containing protein [Methanoculleus sp. FWC-SCC1]